LNQTTGQTMGLKDMLVGMGIASAAIPGYFNGTLAETYAYWDWAREGVYTGKDNKLEIQSYYQYQNRTTSPYGIGGYWPTNVSSWSWDKLHTFTNLGINNPVLADNDNITIWVSEARRPANMSFHAKVKLGEIELKRYRFSDFEYLSSTAWPENAKWMQNYRDGIFDLTWYNKGMYMFLSLPSFYNSDYEFYNEFYGNEKGTEDDVPYIDYEPEFGIAMDGNKRLQSNFMGYADPTCQLGDANPLVFCFKHNNWAVPPSENQDPKDPGYVTGPGWQPAVLIPWVVVQDVSTATSDQIDDFETYVIKLRDYLDQWEDYGWVCIIVGLVFILCQIGAICLCIRNQKMDDAVTYYNP